MPTNSNVDQRIVEMRIDNDKFEAGAKRTLDLLDKLDNSLNGLGKVNSDGFESISKTMDVVNNKFSVMGTIGDQVIRNLTNKAMELTSQFTHMATSMTTDQIGVGFQKFGDKTKAVQTIMSSTYKDIGTLYANETEQLEDVTKKIENLTWYTDETSYAMMDMVSNIGKFTANGQDLQKSVTAMEGIANWASISGGHINEASRAMYNLSQALGLGAVTTIDWKSIENANMATLEFKQTAIDTAEAMGRLVKVADGVWKTVEGGYEVTVENFRNTLNFGRGEDSVKWFDSDVLIETLNKYGAFTDQLKLAIDDIKAVTGHEIIATNMIKALKAYDENNFTELADNLDMTEEEIKLILPWFEKLTSAEYELGRRAFEAAQQARTYQEAVEATREAVSTKWMQIFEYMFGNYLEAKELWTSLSETLWNVFAGPVDTLRKFVKYGFRDYRGGIEGAAESTGAMARSTESFEEKLAKAGHTMEDFKKAVYSVADRSLVDQIDLYNSFEDALKGGVLDEKTFRKAIAAMDAIEGKSISLQRALAQNGKTIEDFESALLSTSDKRDILEGIIHNFGGIEEAIKAGAISAEDFKRALENLGIDSENVTEDVEANVKHAVGSLEEMRQYALEVLRGDHGNGDERLAWYESMGLDAELMQAMAGNLQAFKDMYGTYEMSDEMLLEWMEKYYQSKDLMARLGYTTFEEFLAAAAQTNEELYTTDQMLSESHQILQSIYGNNVFSDTGDLKTGSEMFREGLTNIMTFFDDIAEAFNNAILKAFGGTDEEMQAVKNAGERFWNLAARFLEFTERIQLKWEEADKSINTEKLDNLTSILTVILKIGRAIGKVVGTVLNIGGKLLGLGFKLVGLITGGLVNSGVVGILDHVLDIFIGFMDIVGYVIDSIGNGLTGGFDALTASMQKLIGDHPILMDIFNGIIMAASVIGTAVMTPIMTVIDTVSKAIEKISYYFNIGYKKGGLIGGFQSLIEGTKEYLKKHPVLLEVFNTLVSVATAVGNALTHIGDVFLFIGGIIAAAFGGVYMVLDGLFRIIKSYVLLAYEWLKSNEAINNIFGSISEKLRYFGQAIQYIARYTKSAFQKGGPSAAIKAFADSFRTFFPIGNKIAAFFERLKWAFKGFTIDTSAFSANMQEIGNRINQAWNKLFAAADGEEQKTIGDRVKGFLMSIWQTILEFIREVRISDVIKAFRLGLIASLITEVSGAITVFKNVGKSVKKIPELLNDMIGGLVETMRSFAANIRADTVIKLATAMLMMAGAFFILSKIPEEQLTHVAVVIGIMMYLMTKLAALLQSSKLFGGGWTDVKVFTVIPHTLGILAGVGIALISFAALMLMLRKLSPEELKQSLLTVAALLGFIAFEIGSFLFLLKGFNGARFKYIGSTISKMAVSMLAIAFAVQMLVAPVVIFTLLQTVLGKNGPDNLRVSVIAVIGLIAIMALAMKAIVMSLRSMPPDEIAQVGKALFSAAGAMIIVATAVGMLVASVAVLSLATAFVGGGRMLGSVVAAVVLLGALFAAIAFLIVGFSNIAKMNDQINGQSYIMQNIGTALMKTGVAMMLVAAAVGILMKAVTKIATNGAGFFANLTAFTGVGVMLVGISALVGLFVSELSTIQDNQKIIAIGNTLLKTALAMVIVAAAIRLLMSSITKIATNGAGFGANAGAILGILIIMTAVVLGMIKIVKLLDKMGGYNAAGAERIAAIGKALTGLGAAFALFSVGVLLLTPVIAAFAIVLGNIGKSLLAMDNFVLAFAKLIGLSIGLAALGVVLSVVALALILIAAAFTVFSVGAIIFVAAAVLMANNIDKVKDALPKFVEGLAEAGKTFKANFKDIMLIVGVMAALITILLLINKITKKNGKGGISRFFSNLATSIATSMVNLSRSMGKSFSAMLAGLPTFLTEHKAGILDVVISLIGVIGLYIVGAMPTLVGVIGDSIIALIDSIGDYLQQNAGPLGEAIRKVVQGIVDVAAAVLRAVFSKQQWEGMDGLEKAITIGLGGVAVMNVFKKVRDAISGAKGIVGALSKAKTGVEAFATGATTSLSTVLGVAGALVAVLAIATKVSNDKQRSALEEEVFAGHERDIEGYEYALERLREKQAAINEEINKTGTYSGDNNYATSVFTLINDYEKELAELKAQQDELAQSSATMFGSDAARDEKLAERANQSKQTVEEAKAVAEEVKTSVTESSMALDDLQTKLDNVFGQGAFNANSFVKDGSFNGDALIEAIKNSGFGSKLTELANQFGINIPEGLDAGISGSTNVVETALSTMLETMFLHTQNDPNMLSGSPSRAYATFGESITTGIALGIDRSQLAATSSISRLLGVMHGRFSIAKENFKVFGINLVVGLVNGINSNLQVAYDAGAKLATTVEKGFTDTEKIESPSKVFMDLARYIPIGVARGIEDGSGVAYDSVVYMSSELLKAMQTSMARVATIADDEFEFSPRITPVVDMSNISAASRSMNGVFSGNYSMSAGVSNAVTRRLADLERISAAASGANTITNGDTITFNIYAQPGQDENAIADAVMARMQTQFVRRGAAFG